jgi:hypothetical protein
LPIVELLAVAREVDPPAAVLLARVERPAVAPVDVDRLALGETVVLLGVRTVGRRVVVVRVLLLLNELRRFQRDRELLEKPKPRRA